MSSIDQTGHINVRITQDIKTKIKNIVSRNTYLYTNVSGFVRASVILNITIIKLGLQKEVFKLIREKRRLRK